MSVAGGQRNDIWPGQGRDGYIWNDWVNGEGGGGGIGLLVLLQILELFPFLVLVLIVNGAVKQCRPS